MQPPPPCKFFTVRSKALLLFDLLFLSLYVFAGMSWCNFLFWIAVWPISWERNCPFGFLLVVCWLWCRCFKCVLLSLWRFPSKTPKGKKDALKATTPQSKHYKQKAKRTDIGQTAIQISLGHTMTEIVNHSRSTALERSVKSLTWEWGWGGGLKSILGDHKPRF